MQSPDSLARQRSDLRQELGLRGGERVKLRGFDPGDTRGSVAW